MKRRAPPQLSVVALATVNIQGSLDGETRTNHGVNPVELTSESRRLLLVLVWWWSGKCLDRPDGVDQRVFGDGIVVDSKMGCCYHTVE
jgi:hypothetical protein